MNTNRIACTLAVAALAATCAAAAPASQTKPDGKPNLVFGAIISLDRLPAGATTAQVTPLDSFGNRGRPLSAAIPGEGKE